jgi:hypothetical protein
VVVDLDRVTIVIALFRSDSLLVELLDVSIGPFLAFIASPEKPGDVARGRISVRSPLVRFAVFIDLVTSEVAVHVTSSCAANCSARRTPTSVPPRPKSSRNFSPFFALAAIFAVGLNVSGIMLSL